MKNFRHNFQKRGKMHLRQIERKKYENEKSLKCSNNNVKIGEMRGIKKMRGILQKWGWVKNTKSNRSYRCRKLGREFR